MCAGVLICCALVGCSTRREQPEVDPAAVRYGIAALLPQDVADRQGWAEDIRAAFEALDIRPTAQNICATAAVTQQESTFQVHPVVPGLSKIARREIETRAERYHIPRWALRRALELTSPTGETYEARLSKVKTEKELSDIFEDLIGAVPLGKQLFGSLNPVRTGGPMQVSIAFAQAHAADKPYPYDSSPDVRAEVFTRRGGMYFGIAHLLDYPVSYDRMLFRFSDFNAGHYASRNAAFQNALNSVAKAQLALDGDLIRYERTDAPSQTESALRGIADKLKMSSEEIRRDLERGREHAFERTQLYERVFELADQMRGRPAPRALVPHIRLQSGKITRPLTTEWFANRVDKRYRQCLARGSAAAS